MSTEKPRVICLMPVKNEVDVLPITLDIISKYCDVIIIADQMSDDGSREIYKNFPKVKVIDNPKEGHSNQVRWDLLKEARKYGTGNLIISLDADEYIPPALFENFLKENKFNIGDSFRFPWIQLWKSPEYYNDTGVWYRNYQRAAWVDDGITNYEDRIVINDHTSRIPTGFLNKCKRVNNIPIIHLQWLSWEKTQFKQALYRCTELIKKPKSYISINSAYSISLDKKNVKLSNTNQEWINNLSSLKMIEDLKPSWHKKEIHNLFNKYEILFFEPLQIWHIKELEDEFIKRVGKKPVSVTENPVITFYKNIKRRLIKTIHY
jgi:hypothetical protein